MTSLFRYQTAKVRAVRVCRTLDYMFGKIYFSLFEMYRFLVDIFEHESNIEDMS